MLKFTKPKVIEKLIRMEWKKMKQIMEDHDAMPEFIIHGELRDKPEY